MNRYSDDLDGIILPHNFVMPLRIGRQENLMGQLI